MRTERNFLAFGPSTKLPYEGLSEAVRAVITRAILTAWEKVAREPCVETLPLQETWITAELQEELNRMLDLRQAAVPGFTAGLFERVIRGGEIRSMDGALEKRPDLTFRIGLHAPEGAESTYWGMFVECKPLDSTHSLKNYCDEGLVRFLDCRYAWAMPHGMMVAYMACKLTQTNLADFLIANAAKYRTHGTPTVEMPSPPEIARSNHQREWRGKPSPSGPIEITHLWLRCN